MSKKDPFLQNKPKHSSARAEASRRNGRLGGPKTSEGKAVVANNALRHGLAAHSAVLPTEDASAWQAHRAGILDSLAPETPLETWFAERIALETWRLNRSARVEQAMARIRMRVADAGHEAANDKHYELGRLNTRELRADQYRDGLLETIRSLEAQVAVCSAFRGDAENNRALDGIDTWIVGAAFDLCHEELQRLHIDTVPAEACRFFQRLALAVEARTGERMSLEDLLHRAAVILKASLQDVRAELAAFDRDVELYRERKALPETDRLDLLLRYESAASRSLSRLLAEYRNLRSEDSPEA